MAVIECEKLCKSYKIHKKAPGMGGAVKALFKPKFEEVPAVIDVSMTLNEGEIVGFLGPNGAGKTTTLKMMSGILVPTSGRARVLGFDPWDRNPELLRQMALVMGNKNQLWWDLPAWDSFVVLRDLYEVDPVIFDKRVKRLIETLDLGEKINTQVRKLSLGERMKCELVAALLHAPKIIYLDEPTIGLDIVSQKRIRDFLKELHDEEGSTIILTSHYMQDVRELCERVIVINKGTKIFDDRIDKLLSKFGDQRTVALVFDKNIDSEDLVKYGSVVSNEEGTVSIEVPREETAHAVSKILAELPVVDVQIHEPSIDDVIRRLFSEPQESSPS